MAEAKTILITGGAGYIGSHTVLCCLQVGYDVVVIDNLSNGHREAIERVEELTNSTVTFVHGDVRAFERVTGVAIPCQIVDRRAGDLPEFWADAELAGLALGWSAKRDLDAMMADTWRWQSANPEGFVGQ